MTSAESGPSVTVQFSLAHGGWTVICGTCRAWFGPYMAADRAHMEADTKHAHRADRDSQRDMPDEAFVSPPTPHLFTDPPRRPSGSS